MAIDVAVVMKGASDSSTVDPDVVLPTAPPAVSSISPSLGDQSGGTPVTITGTGFASATSAALGGSNLTSFTVVNDTTITGVTASGTRGLVNVTVTSPYGTGTLSNGYEYFNPLSNGGVLAWYRMDLAAGLIAGKLHTLSDQSGVGDANRNLTAFGADLTYTSSDAAYNNKATATLTSIERLESNAAWAAPAPYSQPFTVYAVGNISNSNGRIIDGETSHRIILMNVGGVWNLYAGVSFEASAADATIPSVVCGVYDATSAIYIDNHTTAGASGASGSDTLTRLTLGAFLGGGGEMAGKIAEVYVCSGAHSVATRLKNMQYLGQRYGITVT